MAAAFIETGNPPSPNHVITPNKAVGVALNSVEPIQPFHVRLTLTSVVVSVVSGATSIGGTKLADLPDKNFLVLNSETNLTFVKGGDFVAGDDLQISLGAVTAASEALNGADANILGAQDKNDGAVAGFTLQVSRFTSNAAAGTVGNIIDSATNAIYLNAACDDDGLAATGTLTVTGTIDLWLLEVGNVTS